ncbi:hypothetical protein [Salidesulfovibrio onnuriiensis]|uniref:hypothetical protein n=1 Tax=Salidesulfovibrio onnuriiensis TaxID=2583823 RepID=UPI0011CBE866|nr:hypothetical protein [Salidesulfovibrio onnuriiensis]
MQATRRIFLSALLLGASLLVLVSGCTPRKAFRPGMDTPPSAWSVFRESYCAPLPAQSVSVTASLFYTRVLDTGIKRSNRTTLNLWGDFARPLRLDVAAGIGHALAHIREDSGGLTAFYPDQKAAYTHVNPVLGATRMGMPFPFSLQDLARVLAGSFSSLVPERYDSGERTAQGYEFRFDRGPVSLLVLDGWARPVRLEGATRIYNGDMRGWSIEFDRYPDEAKGVPQPGVLNLSIDNGETGVLRVKSRSFRNGDWPGQALDLSLPEGTDLFRLDTNVRSHEEES